MYLYEVRVLSPLGVIESFYKKDFNSAYALAKDKEKSFFRVLIVEYKYIRCVYRGNC